MIKSAKSGWTHNQQQLRKKNNKGKEMHKGYTAGFSISNCNKTTLSEQVLIRNAPVMFWPSNRN